MKRIICLVLLLFMMLVQPMVASNNETRKEILDLKAKISNDLSNNAQLNEKYYKHRIAQQQAKLIILSATNFIYNYHRGKKSYKQIYEFVQNAYECSFIFTGLGGNHLDIFMTYLRWAQAETEYTPDQISQWKKGQQIKEIRMDRKGRPIEHIIIIKSDSTDYGILQVNNHNFETVRHSVAKLYKSGVVPFKVKSIKSCDDLLDIKTNLVARSVIETERKDFGWNYKHYSYNPNSVDFTNRLHVEIALLRKQDLYDVSLVQKYYHLCPVKTYSK